MMDLKGIKTGLEIFSKYYDKPDGYHLGAEHDELYVYRTDTPLSPEDIEIVVDLGWFQPGVCYSDGESFKGTDYDRDEPWMAFV